MVYYTHYFFLQHNTWRCLCIAPVFIEDHTNSAGHLPHIIVICAVSIGHTFKKPAALQSILITQQEHLLSRSVSIFL